VCVRGRVLLCVVCYFTFGIVAQNTHTYIHMNLHYCTHMHTFTERILNNIYIYMHAYDYRHMNQRVLIYVNVLKMHVSSACIQYMYAYM